MGNRGVYPIIGGLKEDILPRTRTGIGTELVVVQVVHCIVGCTQGTVYGRFTPEAATVQLATELQLGGVTEFGQAFGFAIVGRVLNKTRHFSLLSGDSGCGHRRRGRGDCQRQATRVRCYCFCHYY